MTSKEEKCYLHLFLNKKMTAIGTTMSTVLSKMTLQTKL